jgi:hypothetical protein
MFARSRSPALPPSRPSGLIDPHQPAEYPVLLGNGFQDAESRSSKSVSMRYNWKAHKATSISRISLSKTKSEPDDSYELIVEDRLHKNKPYRYTGRVRGTPGAGDDEDSNIPSFDQSLALVWDPAKSAFVLEPVSASLDFNLVSAPDQSQREINTHKKLQSTSFKEDDSETGTMSSLPGSDSDSEPDSSNPYDFRHFLGEARENSANGALRAGSKTPVPGSRTPIPGSKTPLTGSRTPLPGLSSPALVANKSTPQFHATSSTSAPTKKRKLERPSQMQKPKPQAISRKQAPSSQKLSSERIIDSDEEANEATLSQPPLPSTNHRKQLSTLNSPSSKPQKTQQSSPHLIVEDADAELEIDLGSPPKYTQRKRPNINPDAFHHRSNANTPRIDNTQNSQGDVEMPDADVEELALGSPRSAGATRGMSVAMHAGRIEQSDPVDVEEDDDDLAAELEAALEEEAAEGEGVGLGITAGKEDESEVSEEE